MYAAKKVTTKVAPNNTAASKSQDNGMQPLQLINTGLSGDEFNLNIDALRIIEAEERPITAIAIVGPTRSGKSYLMNRLKGRSDGFSLGSTVCAKTKGFWFWKGDFPTDPKRCLLLLDVEGLGDPKKFNHGTHDLKLFTQALLSCTMLIYNTMGTIDASALDCLHLATKIVDDMMKEGAQSENVNFGINFPHFVWAIRDQFLELKNEKGKILTPDELLEDCLNPIEFPSDATEERKASVEEYNFIRNAIREFFPKRNCFIFPRPAADENIAHLDKLSNDELYEKFKESISLFLKFVNDSAKNHKIEGSNLNGRAYSRMFQKFFESINKKNLSINSTYEMVAQEGNQKAFRTAVKNFNDVFANTLFPISSENFANLSKKAMEIGYNSFLENGIGIKATSSLLTDLTSTLKEMVNKRALENTKSSREKCELILNKLYEPIDSRIEQYFVEGGYNILKKDIDNLTVKYNCSNDDDVGPCKYDVFQNFQKEKFLPILKHILHSQNQMSELKKKEADAKLISEKIENENKRLAAEIKAQEQAIKSEKNAAENNLKKITDKMEEQHKEKMEQLKTHIQNQEKELNRIQVDAAANLDVKKVCQEMFDNQMREYEKLLKIHREEMDKIRKEQKRMNKTYEENLKKVEEKKSESLLDIIPKVAPVAGLVYELFKHIKDVKPNSQC